jgi:hypothetical protein
MLYNHAMFVRGHLTEGFKEVAEQMNAPPQQCALSHVTLKPLFLDGEKHCVTVISQLSLTIPMHLVPVPKIQRKSERCAI